MKKEELIKEMKNCIDVLELEKKPFNKYAGLIYYGVISLAITILILLLINN